MICLCLETATARVGVAVTRDGRLLAETLLDAPGGLQNRLLMPELRRLLESCHLGIEQIDLFACATGPGSFTGIRTGIAATQGLALAADRPCVGVSTLAMLALNLPHSAAQVCPMLDARKQEVYTALYRVSELPDLIQPDCAVAPEIFLRTITAPTIFLGDGALRYRELISQTLGSNALFAPPITDTLRAATGCLLAQAAYIRGNVVPPASLLPTYLRLSEAEVARLNK